MLSPYGLGAVIAVPLRHWTYAFGLLRGLIRHQALPTYRAHVDSPDRIIRQFPQTTRLYEKKKLGLSAKKRWCARQDSNPQPRE